MRSGNFSRRDLHQRGSRTAAVPMMTRLTPLPSQPSIGRHVADAAAELHAQPDRLQDPLDRRNIHRLARERAVEIDDVQMVEALGLERVRLRRRVAVEHGRARHVALLEAHGEAVLEIDGGKQDHARLLRPSGNWR